MASLTRRRMPAAKPPLTPCSVRSCRTVFKSSGSVRWVVMDLLWMCLVTPQQETIMARPRPVFCGGSPPSGTAALRLATLASAPPPPKGGWAEGRRAIYRTTFTPAINRPWGGFDVALMWLWGGLPAQSRITNHESPPALGGFAAFPEVLAQAGVPIVASAEC